MTALTTSAWASATFGAGARFTGLIYPIAVCLMTLVVGGFFVKETRTNRLDEPSPPGVVQL